MNNVDRIRQCEAEADELEGRADLLRWEAAELIARELATGVSQRTLADKIGKTQPHVSYMNRVWLERDNHGYQDGSSFDSVYQQVKRGKKVVEASVPSTVTTPSTRTELVNHLEDLMRVHEEAAERYERARRRLALHDAETKIQKFRELSAEIDALGGVAALEARAAELRSRAS